MTIRDKFVNVRFTEEEYVNLLTLMDLEGYNSRSRFIRTRIFDTAPRRRNLSKNEANTAKQYELLNSQIHKIGINYNQVVKAINTVVGIRDKTGKTVISQAMVEYKLGQLKKQMDNIIKLLQSVAPSEPN